MFKVRECVWLFVFYRIAKCLKTMSVYVLMMHFIPHESPQALEPSNLLSFSLQARAQELTSFWRVRSFCSNFYDQDRYFTLNT